jgi:hypothetical protein
MGVFASVWAITVSHHWLIDYAMLTGIVLCKPVTFYNLIEESKTAPFINIAVHWVNFYRQEYHLMSVHCLQQ